MKARIQMLAAALPLLLAAPGAAHAQDAQDAQDTYGSQDVFDASAFDQSVKESAEQDRKAGLETQFGGNVLYDTSASTTAELAGYGAAGSLSGKAFVKVSVPDRAILYLAYNFSKNLYQGASGAVPGAQIGPAGPVLSQPAGDLYGVSYALSELTVSMDIARAVYVRIGNQLLSWGPSIIWTPVDFINIQRVDPLSPLDLRVGKPGIRVTVPFGISTFFLFADLSGTVTPTGAGGALTVNDPLKTASLGARWDSTLFGAELALTAFLGSSVQSRAGFDFSGRLLGFDVYGEAAAGLPTGGWPFTWSSSLGFQRALGELKYWNVAAEVYVNEAGTSDPAAYPALAAAGQLNPLYVGRLYVYAALTRSHLAVDGVSATLAGFVDASDASFLARLSTTIGIPGMAPFTLSVSWAGGGPGKAFTYFTGNDALSVDLQVQVSF